MKIKYFIIIAISSSFINCPFATEVERRGNEFAHPSTKIESQQSAVKDVRNEAKQIITNDTRNESEKLAVEKALSKNIGVEDIREALEEYRALANDYSFLKDKPHFEILKGGYISIDNGL